MVRSSASRHRASSHGTPSSTFLLTLAVAAALSSCKGSLPDEGAKSELDAVNDVTEDAGQVIDVGSETDVLDAAEFDIPLDSTIVDTTVDSCPGGEGCPCAGNDTCDNGVCLDTHEGKRCARACVDACPAGYSCQKYGSVDGAFFCVSSHLSLCAPCETHAECQVDGVLALCIAYGSEGSFCGAPCKADGDCPGGYECKDADDGKGGTAKQCRRTAGKSCECSAWAKDKAAHTTCAVANGIGTCTAARKCGPEGLEACAAKTPTVEVCNAEDDDCDGKDDNLPAATTCTKKAYTAGGSGEECETDVDCQSDGEGCDGGKCRPLIGACSGNPVCVGGKLLCVEAKTPEVETCNNKDDDCDGLVDEDFAIDLPGGATLAVGAVCGEGSCAGGTVKCVAFDKAACSTDDKKAEKEDCNGKDDDCDGQTDEAACDDGDACTKDTCDAVKLACSHTTAVDCDDGEVCTVDKCDAKTGECSHDGQAQDTKTCSDGDQCTQGDTCKAGKCAPGIAKVCDDTNPCTDDGCKAEVGCINQGNVAGCDDGDACTAGDKCAAGKCAAGKAVTCADDGQVCTLESCDKAKGCVSLPTAGTCTDGDACTAGDKCAAGKCAAGEAVVCADDGEVCTAESCDKTKGCVSAPTQATCTDGDACTTGDGCAEGKCAGGALANCDDGNSCTDDSCDKAKGCVQMPSKATCSDDDACTEGDGCAGAKCLGGAKKDCDDGNTCTADACDAKAGCTHAASVAGAPCDDGEACTVGGSCAAGSCTAGPPSLWNRTFGGTANDYAQALAPLADGGFALAGRTDSTDLPQGQKTAGNGDFWLVRTDAAGKLLWNRTFGGGNYDQAGSISPLVGGGFALVGTTQSTDLPQGEKTAGSYDLWLVRTDDAGNLLWSHTLGGTKDDHGFALTPLADGGFALAGRTNSTDLPQGQKTSGNWDFWLVRIDSAGALVWNRTFGGTGSETAWAVTPVPGGGFALAGQTNSSDLPQGQKTAGGEDAWLVRTDDVGNVLWNRTFGGSGHDLVAAVTPLAGGGFALAGSTASADLPQGQKTAGIYDFWLIRTDDAGNLLWSRTFGGTSNDQGAALTPLAGGGFALAGQTKSTDLPQGQKTAGGDDFWLVRTDDAGNLVWNRTFGGTGSDIVTALAPLANGGFALSGQTNSTDLPQGQKTKGGSDFWLVRTDAWGSIDCKWAGLCAGKTAADCDDNNGCTADLCDAAKGCTHQAAQDGLACGGGKECNAGKCVAPEGMVLVPAGTFWMGCNEALDKACQADEKPQHEIALGAYWMDANEVTVGAYKTCVQAGACSAPETAGGQCASIPKWNNWLQPGRDEHPQNCVSWKQAASFCDWGGKRLPTEAEWERAARGGCETLPVGACQQGMRTYSWGEEAPSCSKAVMVGGSISGCGTNSTWAVGQKPGDTSPYGLRDTGGNVSEWVRDVYDAGYYGKSSKTDPMGPTLGSLHKPRGGNFDFGAEGQRSSARWAAADWAKGNTGVGFRCARGASKCDDGDPCTVDVHDGKTGDCSYKVKNCDDGDACTIDTCGEFGACGHGVLPDGTLCAPAIGCVAARVCVAGSCQAGAPRLFQKVYGGGQDDVFSDIVADGASWVLAGWSKSKGGTWVARAAPDGSEIWSNVYGTSAYNAHAGVAVSGATILAVAGVGGGGSSYGLQFAWLDPAGKLSSLKKVAAPVCQQLQGRVVAFKGGFASAAYKMTGQGVCEDAWVLWTDLKGEVAKQSTLGGVNIEEAQAIHTFEDGLVLGGWYGVPTGGGNAGDGWAARLSALGEPKWVNHYGGQGDQSFRGVTEHQGQVALCGGSDSNSWVVMLDGSGQLIWQRKFGSAKSPELAMAVISVGASLALAGTMTSSGTRKGWLARTDNLGNVIWRREWSPSGWDIHSGLIGSSGGFTVVGERRNPKTNNLDGLILSSDAWGQTSCDLSGPCASMKLTDCSDKNPCTADLCDAAHKGCWHQNFVDGSPCGTGKQCQAGVCL